MTYILDKKYKSRLYEFKEECISISYQYFFPRVSSMIRQIERSDGDIIKLIKNYNLYKIQFTTNKHIQQKCYSEHEITKHKRCYFYKFSIDIEKIGFELEYEFLLYHKLNSVLGNILIHFPKVECFFFSKKMNHIGYILSPILLRDYQINGEKQLNSRFQPLRTLFEKDKIEITDIVDIVVQICAFLELAQRELQFTHYGCDTEHLLTYSIETHKRKTLHKYLQYHIENYGTIYVQAKNIILLSNLQNAHINIRQFHTKMDKNIIIQHWIAMETTGIKSSTYSRVHDIYTLMMDIYRLMKKHKNVVGKIDKKTIFSIICKSIETEWINYNGDETSLTYQTPIDLIRTFHEMGLTSLRLPSNRTVELYHYGDNGREKRTYLTYNPFQKQCSIENIRRSTNSSSGINIDKCSWKEIQTIAKEFGLKRYGKGINKAFLKRKIKEALPYYSTTII